MPRSRLPDQQALSMEIFMNNLSSLADLREKYQPEAPPTRHAHGSSAPIAHHPTPALGRVASSATGNESRISGTRHFRKANSGQNPTRPRHSREVTKVTTQVSGASAGARPRYCHQQLLVVVVGPADGLGPPDFLGKVLAHPRQRDENNNDNHDGNQKFHAPSVVPATAARE